MPPKLPRTDCRHPSAGALTAKDARAADADNRRIARTGASLRARKGAATAARAAGAPQAEAQEAAPRLRARRPLGPRCDLHGLRHADGRGERPAGARERGRVPGRRELGALCGWAGLQGARRARVPDRQAHRQPQPDPRAGGRHLAPHQERGHSDRGPALLRARGPRLPGHRARPVAGHPPPQRRPGRFDDHPAVRQERALGSGRPLGLPEASRVGARLPPRAQVVQGEDPHPVPEHRLLRKRRVRDRVRDAHLLRRRRRGRRAPHRDRRLRRRAPAGAGRRGGGTRSGRALF